MKNFVELNLIGNHASSVLIALEDIENVERFVIEIKSRKGTRYETNVYVKTIQGTRYLCAEFEYEHLVRMLLKKD